MTLMLLPAMVLVADLAQHVEARLLHDEIAGTARSIHDKDSLRSAHQPFQTSSIVLLFELVGMLRTVAQPLAQGVGRRLRNAPTQFRLIIARKTGIVEISQIADQQVGRQTYNCGIKEGGEFLEVVAGGAGVSGCFPQSWVDLLGNNMQQTSLKLDLLPLDQHRRLEAGDDCISAGPRSQTLGLPTLRTSVGCCSEQTQRGEYRNASHLGLRWTLKIRIRL